MERGRLPGQERGPDLLEGRGAATPGPRGAGRWGAPASEGLGL